MSHEVSQALAFLVSRLPYEGRAARSEVDFVLSALAMDRPAKVFFLGRAVLQLARSRELAGSGLAPGYKAWSALPDFGDAECFAEPEWLDWCAAEDIELGLPVTPLEAAAMRSEWLRCAHVVAL